MIWLYLFAWLLVGIRMRTWQVDGRLQRTGYTITTEGTIVDHFAWAADE